MQPWFLFLLLISHNEGTDNGLRKRTPSFQVPMHASERGTWCAYAFGKNGNVTSPRRWARLRKSAEIAGVSLHEMEAEETEQAHYNITCCSSKPYLGLWKSNFVIWNTAYSGCNKDWVVVFENDATIPSNFQTTLSRYTTTNSYDVIWLDSRLGYHAGPSECCCVGMAYRRSILPLLILQFDVKNTNAIWTTWTRRTCLFDWYLYDVVRKLGLRAYTAGIVRHPPTNKEKDA